LEEIVAQLRLENEFFRSHAGEELITKCKEREISFSTNQLQYEDLDDFEIPESHKMLARTENESSENLCNPELYIDNRFYGIVQNPGES